MAIIETIFIFYFRYFLWPIPRQEVLPNLVAIPPVSGSALSFLAASWPKPVRSLFGSGVPRFGLDRTCSEVLMIPCLPPRLAEFVFPREKFAVMMVLFDRPSLLMLYRKKLNSFSKVGNLKNPVTGFFGCFVPLSSAFFFSFFWMDRLPWLIDFHSGWR